MNLLDGINNLAEKGIKIEISFEEKTIQRFLLWGIVAAVVSGVILAIIKKQLQ
jgi:hypothetical protein